MFVCCVIVAGCADLGDSETTYVVRSDDTLYSIAWRHGLDFHDLARWNDIGSDYRIAVGQVLVLTPRAQRTGAPPPTVPAATQSAPAPSNGRPGARAAAPGAGTGSPIAPRLPSAASPALSWQWPTDRLSPPRPVPGGGILIMGHLGQDVRAASAGRVVYNGNGIRGYGNLIIIKHGEVWLTSYAHNRDSLVHEGQDVSAGQIIGHMGEGVPHTAALYFEIRENGKPVDPMALLPVK